MNNRLGGTANTGRQSDEAVDWFVANETDEELRRVTLLQWEGWCARRKNRADYAAVIRLRQELGALPRPTLPSRAELLEDIAEQPAVATLGRTSVRATKPLVRGPHYLQSLGRIVAVAVSMVLVATVSISLFREQGFGPPATLDQSYMTAPGEQSQLLLPDGSNITMGGDTALIVRFTGGTREIDLDRGEAYFSVQHDPRRPFMVHAGVGTTTAVGTAFAVRRYADHVKVWVREGTVEVKPLEDIKEVANDGAVFQQNTLPVSVRVARGQEMSYDAQGEANAPHSADPRLAAAWIAGHLVPLIYRGRLLTEVIGDVQPYTRRQIMIDPAAADLQYTGIIVPEDVDAWIRDLPTIYPEVEVIDCRTSDGPIPSCSDPERIVIRLRLRHLRGSLKSALR